MKRLLFLLLWLSTMNIHAIDVVLNTQLDEKLKNISVKGINRDKAFEFNVLRKIEFYGLETISEDTVRNEISVFTGDKLDPFTISRNLKRLEGLGFFDEVSSDLEDFEGGKKWIITVKENPTVEKIIFDGNESISDDELFEIVETKIGEIFNFSIVRDDVQRIESAFTDQGFMFVKVKKVDLPTYKDEVLTFMIEESQFDEVGVSGNTKTKDYVILREMDIKPGDKVNEKELKKNLQRIYNLNYFGTVFPDIRESSSTKNAYNLIINVEEKSTDSVNFGGGWGQRSGGFLYSDLNINNFLGTGQLIALRGQWGSNVQTYQFKYHNPWMFGERKSFTYRAWNTRGNYGYNNMFNTGYRPEIRYGMDASVGLPHSYELRSIHKVKLEKVIIEESDNSNAEEYSIQSYAFSLIYDTRDIRFNPLNGAYYVGTIENGFKLQSDSLIFTKYDISMANFFQTFEKQTIATRFIAGRINGQIETTEYYYIGGPNTVRGYIEYPNSFGVGKSQLLLNLEYRFILSEIFQFLFFLDAGWASSLGSDITKGKVGKGLGFRISSPLGPIRIDFGFDEDSEMRTHFNIGHIF